MKYPLFCGSWWKPNSKFYLIDGYGLWFRIKGYGLHFTNNPPLFSERNSYEKRYKLLFGFRMKILKPEKRK